MESNEVTVINPEGAPGKGRPTMYKAGFSQIAYRLALLGNTNEEIAKALGVSLSTFKTWLKQYPDFLTTVQAGKEIADGMAAEGLFKRACGYDYPSEKILVVNDEVVRVPIIVHVPPDAGAALNWLKNRQPKLWRDKQDVSLSGEITVTMNLSGDTKLTEASE